MLVPASSVRAVRGPGFNFVRGALHLPSWRMWLDAHHAIGPEESVFVSHAHSDHTANHAEVFLSEPTRRLMRARVSGQRQEHVLAWGERTDLRDPRFGRSREGFLTLLPAGHILGSAMSLLEGEQGSLLYTGDFQLRASLAAETCEPRHADVLVMETTFGRPKYVFPPAAEVLQGVLRFCREALDNDEVPILLGYSLGKAQEILASLRGAGLPVLVTDPVLKMNRVYEALGVEFPAHRGIESAEAAGHVVLAPPGGDLAALKRRVGPARVAVLTGWAMDSGCRFRYRVDAAFPLSDHADHPDLMEFVRRVSPKVVYTLHGFAAEFAADLRAEGIEAWALAGEEQLELGLGGRVPGFQIPVPSAPENPGSASAPSGSGHSSPGSSSAGFPSFVAACNAIRQEPSKSEKIRYLAEYLRELPTGMVSVVTTWWVGRTVVPTRGRVAPTSGALLREAVCVVSGRGEAEFRRAYVKHSDVGEAAAELIGNRGRTPSPGLSLESVIRALDRLAAARSPDAIRAVLVEVLGGCRGEEVRILVKLLNGDLRIGLTASLVEEAVAMAFGVEARLVHRASLISGCLGEVAERARAGTLDEADPGLDQPMKTIPPSSPTTEEASSPDRQLRFLG